MPSPVSGAAHLGETELTELYQACYLDLVRFAVQLVDDQATAEDVVQDVFAALQARHRRLDDPVRYLRTAVLNRARSVLRRRRTARLFLTAPPFRAREHAHAADESSVRHDERTTVLAAVARLPHRQREVVVLRYYEELGIGEIAALLEITSGAVSSSLNRALATLSTSLGEDHV